MKKFGRKIMQWIAEWLTKESPPSTSPLCDFNRLSYELRPADVLLVEGRSRISNVIKTITQSTWTHSALYIGRIYDIRDPQLQQRVRMAYQGDLSEQLMVEALLGEGTIIAPLSKYRKDHLRICRPAGLEPEDAHKVVAHAIKHIGFDYDVRHLLDLARFFFPWAILPRRWRSSLFEHNAGSPTRTVCSSLLASAFNNVNFPILPFIDRDEDGSLRFFKRNPRLFTPKDFDYSPYFDIIKYPFLGLDDLGVYRRLPWCDDTILYNDNERAFVASTKIDEASCDADETLAGGDRPGDREQQAQTEQDETDQPVANSLREANQ
ncbi:MAG: YiiX/YebB-like N1pC/P60 family cysteine hydrolase [Candidatus Thiodiazotropha sp.]